MTTFQEPLTHSNDPEPSFRAAETNSTSETHQAMLLEAFRDVLLRTGCPNYTDEEAGHATGLDTVEARRRCSNLRDKGLIEFTGASRMGIRFPTKTQGVSQITHAGLDALGICR